MKRLQLRVKPAEDGVTLSKLLLDRGGLNSGLLGKALGAGGVSVNRQRVFQGDLVLSAQDEVAVFLEEAGRRASGTPSLSPDCVVLLRHDLVVVNKPPGIPSQGTPVDAHAGMDAALSRLLRENGERKHFVGLVHRLDLQTSGLMVFGRSRQAVSFLGKQLREGRFHKRYLALVLGNPPWDEQVVEAPLGPSRRRRGAREVRAQGGEPARTAFRCVERYGEGETALSLLEAVTFTGRTHQIRVHAAHLGHPLAGDRLYGGPSLLTFEGGQRLDFAAFLLHASKLSFPAPGGGEIALKSPPGGEFERFLGLLRAMQKEEK